MIIKAIIEGFMKFFLGPLSIIPTFITMTEHPRMYFTWVADVMPYFECMRYILPLEQLIPLFMAIIAITLIRIVIALIRVIFGKIIPIW